MEKHSASSGKLETKPHAPLLHRVCCLQKSGQFNKCLRRLGCGVSPPLFWLPHRGTIAHVQTIPVEQEHSSAESRMCYTRPDTHLAFDGNPKGSLQMETLLVKNSSWISQPTQLSNSIPLNFVCGYLCRCATCARGCGFN